MEDFTGPIIPDQFAVAGLARIATHQKGIHNAKPILGV